MKDITLAIDPGSLTGWALWRPSGFVAFGTWKLVGSGGDRSLSLRDHLSAMLSREEFAALGYEEPYQSGFKNAVRSLYHLEGEIQSFCAFNRIPMSAYSPKEIKASTAGGRATKERMINVVRWLGYPVSDDHQADAMALLLMMMKDIKPAEGIKKEAARQFKKKVLPLFHKSKKTRIAAE